ncbi:MAG: hypothetical protein AMXMBFR64_31810 [Myxococcales bacterium]
MRGARAAVTSGAGRSGGAPCTAVPQEAQNRSEGRSIASQAQHWSGPGGRGRRDPHAAQKRAPGRPWWPHAVQSHQATASSPPQASHQADPAGLSWEQAVHFVSMGPPGRRV